MLLSHLVKGSMSPTTVTHTSISTDVETTRPRGIKSCIEKALEAKYKQPWSIAEIPKKFKPEPRDI